MSLPQGGVAKLRNAKAFKWRYYYYTNKAAKPHDTGFARYMLSHVAIYKQSYALLPSL